MASSTDPPPEFAKKIVLRGASQLSIGKYVRLKLFKSNHVGWGVSNTPWTRSRCPKVFLRLSSASEATFLLRQHQKSVKSLIFLVRISKAKFQWFHTFWCCLTKKVALADEKRLKNIFGHRERVQQVLLTPQLTWFHLKSFCLTYFPIESWKTLLRLVFLANSGGGGHRKPP